MYIVCPAWYIVLPWPKEKHRKQNRVSYVVCLNTLPRFSLSSYLVNGEFIKGKNEDK
jgi:hypothetical protein